jgi:hypothetical protein
MPKDDDIESTSRPVSAGQPTVLGCREGERGIGWQAGI